MPKAKSEAGKADVVVAYRNSAGHRVEFNARVDEAIAVEIMQASVVAAKRTPAA